MNFHNSKIYKLVNIVTNQIYIGSTTKPLMVRFNHHRSSHNKAVSRTLFYPDVKNVCIELLEEYPCNTINELRARELHYISLNKALAEAGEQYVINREEHLATFDGLNTTRKLELLTELKGLPTSLYDSIWNNKQKLTFDLLKQIPQSGKLIDICQRLKELGYNIREHSPPNLDQA